VLVVRHDEDKTDQVDEAACEGRDNEHSPEEEDDFEVVHAPFAAVRGKRRTWVLGIGRLRTDVFVNGKSRCGNTS
jgi:hypothetical protein